MSFYSSGRPKLSDRYRGKSGDEILNELKNQLDEDKKMFFESNPGWSTAHSPGSSSKASQPLDDVMSRGRQDIRSHLDDLAQRHPEFADHLRCPPWGGEISSPSRGTWGRKRRGSGSSGDDNTAGVCGAQDGEQIPSRGRSRPNNLPQYGLRNTVDMGQQQKQQRESDSEKIRGQRSWSAPPDNRSQNPPDPPRYVSRLDINPVGSSSATDQGKPPLAPKQPQTSSAQSQHSNSKQNQGGNVRHIPIFVEGRDEPLLPKDTESAPEETERVPQQQQYSSFAYSRPSHFTSHMHQNPSQPQHPQHPQQPSQPHFMNNEGSFTMKSKPQEKQPPQPQPKQQQEQVQKPSANDPISRVQCVHKDIQELRIKVESFKGTSGKDKEYMYLDEMLTRNLLKLDDIDTEGKENVRQARKDAIREIQNCISLLESKVPNPDDSKDISEDTKMSSKNDFKTPSLPMDQNCPESKHNTQKLKVINVDRNASPLDSNESQKQSCPVARTTDSAMGVDLDDGSISNQAVRSGCNVPTAGENNEGKDDLTEMDGHRIGVGNSIEKMDVQQNKCDISMSLPGTHTEEAPENIASSKPVTKSEDPSKCSSKDGKYAT